MMNVLKKILGGDSPAAETEREETPLATSHQHAGIAEIHHMGQTAVATLTVTELSQENGADRLAGLLDDLAQTGASHFVLDMQNVQFMDTTCIGCMVTALNGMASRGGRIAVANPDHSIEYMFKLTRLDRVFPICQDVMSAIQAVERTKLRDAG